VGPGTGAPVRGFKDMVIAYPGQVTHVKARSDLPGRYVWHCHIPEHEAERIDAAVPGRVRLDRAPVSPQRSHLNPQTGASTSADRTVGASSKGP
jgi:hypothetical protein